MALEYYEPLTTSWQQLLTNVTLTGAVTGSGGSTINTVLNSVQNMSSSVLSFNWPTVIESDIYHFLPDSSPISSSVPQFFETIRAGNGSNIRQWSIGFQPGFASSPSGSFLVLFYHNTYSAGSAVPFRIDCNGGTVFTTNISGNLVLTGSLNLGGNIISNVATPVLSTDGVNKNYADTSTITPSRISGYPTNSSLYLNGLGSWSTPTAAVSLPLNLYTSSLNDGITIYNSNNSATATGFWAYNQNTNNGAQFGFNSSTLEGYVWTGSGLSLKFGTNNTLRIKINSSGSIDCQSNDILTTGTINAQTGTLKGNNLAAYNSGSIVVLNPLAMNNNAITGLPNPVNALDGVNKQYVDTAVSRSILHGYNAATYSTNVGVGDHLKFDSVAFSSGSGISLDTSTTYNTSTNTASIGRITLAGGKTYKLTGSINNVVSANYNATRWYNSDSNTALGLLSGAASPISTTDRVPSAGTIAYITTSGTTRVELRITWNSFSSVNGTGDAIGPAWFTVETI